MTKREALAAKERALGNTENVPYNKVSEELADQVPNLADAYMRAQADIRLALGCYMVRCHRKDHKPLRFPFCKDCQADARMEEIAQRFRDYHKED